MKRSSSVFLKLKSCSANPYPKPHFRLSWAPVRHTIHKRTGGSGTIAGMGKAATIAKEADMIIARLIAALRKIESRTSLFAKRLLFRKFVSTPRSEEHTSELQ